MKKFIIIHLLLLLSMTLNLMAQDDTTAVYTRQYKLVFGASDELEIFATTGVTLNKAFIDLYQQGIAHRLPAKLAPWIETIWSINWTFFFTMWPHDGGHWARAQQVGGDFLITKFGYPFPVAKMRLPEVMDRKYETLTSIGGHEINYLMRQQVHLDYYDKQYAFADELIFSFIQDIFYPMYAFLLAYADPTNPAVWTDTRGDPIESTLSVYKNYTGRDPIREDGSVDPELIDQYRTNTYLSLLWPLLNPMLYRSAKAFTVDMAKDHGLMKAPWMLGNDRFAYSWGTIFHPSPLGYELYLNNYFRYNGKLYLVYMKTGHPFKNNGIGFQIPRLLEVGKFCLGLSADVWDQDIHGKGGNVVFSTEYQLQKGFRVIMKGGWKSAGYLVGRRVDESPLLLVGGSYSF